MGLQRLMLIYTLALVPCALWGIYNTGLQANLALDPARAAELAGWRHAAIGALGVGYAPESLLANLVHGALYVAPLYLVIALVGRAWEWLFALARRRPLDAGFWPLSLTVVLILPATTPLWQAALAISWGVVIAKLIFGGTGMNVLNPALVARAFLFYAYPAQIVGERVWLPVPPAATLDGYSGATALMQLQGAEAAAPGLAWWEAFVGLQAGSIGETSAAACLAGLLILLGARVVSWRIVAGMALGTIAMALALNGIGPETNGAFAIPFWWHMVLGGWAFSAAFLATDPVTAPYTQSGRWIYGLLIGALTVLIRVLNPAYPESVMLVILFMNVFAALLDHLALRIHLRRRAARRAA